MDSCVHDYCAYCHVQDAVYSEELQYIRLCNHLSAGFPDYAIAIVVIFGAGMCDGHRWPFIV